MILGLDFPNLVVAKQWDKTFEKHVKRIFIAITTVTRLLIDLIVIRHTLTTNKMKKKKKKNYMLLKFSI